MTNDSTDNAPQSPDAEQHLDDLAAESPEISGSLEAQRYHSTILDVPDEELQGELIVLEGPDGSGRSTQIRLLTEWLELNGFAVQTMGLRRSYLLAQDIDQVLAQNVVRRLTLALLYATDFYDQLENRILPAMKSGLVVLADRYIFTLLARAAARGLGHEYLKSIYSFAIDPDVTFRLRVSPNTSFERIFRESQSINYWEAGGDLNLSENLYDSFVMYQEMIRDQFDDMSTRWDFTEVDGERSVQEINGELREKVADHLGIDNVDFEPSQELMHLWQI
jgi:dTMP kinase